jgi:predicted extracellular nuclease
MSRILLLALLATLAVAAPASAASPDLVISEVYGAGGNNGSDYPSDYVELFNRGSAPASLDGKSLQYASATGTGDFGSVTTLSGDVPPGGYVLVQASGGDIALQAAMGATGGKVALATGTTSLGCNSAATCTDGRIIDLVGYGNANYFEGAGPALGASATMATKRDGEGCTDTDDNAADFAASDQDPDSRATTPAPCGGPPPGDQPPSVSGTDPGQGADEVDRDADLSVTFSEPVDAGPGAFSLSCGGDAIALAVSGGPSEYTLDPAVQLPRDASCALTVEAGAVTDQDGEDPPDAMAADYTLRFTTDSSVAGLRIHDIQGASHISPYRGALALSVPGVVTARRTNGYFIQDPRPDRDARTSEGIFVFTSSAPPAGITPGTAVTVTGRVSEFRSGGASGTANLTTTELTSATALPAGTGTIRPTLVGRGGRVRPRTVIEDDVVSPGDVEQGDPLFDPGEDGIDFYESLEGMLTEVRNAVVVGPTSDFGSNKEIPVLADNGAGATIRAPRGPILVRGFDRSAPQEYRRGDFNPERITLNDTGDPRGTFLPLADVRDRFTQPVRAVVDYNFGAYKFLVTNDPRLADGRLRPEVTRKKHHRELAIASYNVENLDGLDPQERYDRVAGQIVGNLRSPDILSLEEIQDDDGAASPAPTAADVTFTRLLAAIRAAGGPSYAYRQIDPVSNQDGGEPNGNIRVAFLYRTDNRELQFVDRPGGTATTATEPVAGPHLSFSPGRVDPTNAVWASSRKPLAAEFRYRGKPLFVIGNHFNSKGGDDPTFGRFQEPRRPSEVQRHGQADVLNAFVKRILAIDPRARVVALGDLNDFEFSETVRRLERGALVDLWRFVPQDEHYSYVFQGNGQVLDHILVSPALRRGHPDLDAVHINAEFSDQVSDHDPPITRLDVR